MFQQSSLIVHIENKNKVQKVDKIITKQYNHRLGISIKQESSSKEDR